MSKFRKDDGKELPPISTASLPDIVFMLLFFFMVSTTMREVTVNVKQSLPQATELSKLVKKCLSLKFSAGNCDRIILSVERYLSK